MIGEPEIRELEEAQAEAEVNAAMAPCCQCGCLVDTREVSEGGISEGCQLVSGEWVCGPSCWDAVVKL